MAEGGEVEMAATCGMVAGYDVFSIGVEMLIEGFKVGIWIMGVPEYPFRLNVAIQPLFSTLRKSWNKSITQFNDRFSVFYSWLDKVA